MTTKLEPDYDIKCCLCDATPTVTIEDEGVTTYESELCGPCYFGTAAAIDTEEWND
jgi:hypothetical protein